MPSNAGNWQRAQHDDEGEDHNEGKEIMISDRPRQESQQRTRLFKAAIALDHAEIIIRSIRRNAEFEYLAERRLARPGEYQRSLAEIQADFTQRRIEDIRTHYTLAVRRGVFPLDGELIDEDALRFAISRIGFWDRISRRSYRLAGVRLLLDRVMHRLRRT